MVNGNSIRDIVHSMTKEELAGLIIELAAQDPVLKSRLLALQAPVRAGQELKAYQKQFKAIAKKYGDRHGFIAYGRSSAFTAEVGEMLVQARSARKKGLGLDLAFLVLENGLGALQYTDDSNGCIGDLAYEAVQTIKELVAAERTGEESSDRLLFDRLMKYTDSKELADWTDYRQELLTIALDLAEYPALRASLEKKLEGFIETSKKDKYSTYDAEALMKLQLELIKRYGTPEQEELFVEKHLSYSSFREEAIARSLDKGEYEQALKWAQEGEKKDREWPGLINQWKKARYEAYKGLSRREDQLKLGRELLFEGELEYYEELEALEGGDPQAFYQGLIDTLKKSRDWRRTEVYLRLAEQRNDLDELMDYVRRTPSAVEHYGEKLNGLFADELRPIYRDEILEAAANSTNRKEYKRVCKTLKRYGKLAGGDFVQELSSSLRTHYPKRSALLDELDKV